MRVALSVHGAVPVSLRDTDSVLGSVSVTLPDKDGDSDTESERLCVVLPVGDPDQDHVGLKVAGGL